MIFDRKRFNVFGSSWRLPILLKLRNGISMNSNVWHFIHNNGQNIKDVSQSQMNNSSSFIHSRITDFFSILNSYNWALCNKCYVGSLLLCLFIWSNPQPATRRFHDILNGILSNSGHRMCVFHIQFKIQCQWQRKR